MKNKFFLGLWFWSTVNFHKFHKLLVDIKNVFPMVSNICESDFTSMNPIVFPADFQANCLTPIGAKQLTWKSVEK